MTPRHPCRPMGDRRQRVHELLVALLAQQKELDLLDGDSTGNLAAAQANPAGWLERNRRILQRFGGGLANALDGGEAGFFRDQMFCGAFDRKAARLADGRQLIALVVEHGEAHLVAAQRKVGCADGADGARGRLRVERMLHTRFPCCKKLTTASPSPLRQDGHQ